MTSNPRFQDLGFGITCIDTQLYRPGLAACYLIEHNGVAGFIDTGVNNSVPLLLAVLKKKGIPLEKVAWVMPTHVHLDHAGGVGGLMEKLPQARLLIHPRGARHMIEPEKLQAGSMAVYGEDAFLRTFGSVAPVAPDRVDIAEDQFELDFNGRPLRFHDTPGHARHHFCIHDEMSEGIFTGDTFGVSYPELNNGRARFIFPPTTPIQFDPPAWHASIDRLMELSPKRVYVTHFGMHENPDALAAQLHRAIDDYAETALEELGRADQRKETLKRTLLQNSINHLLDIGCGLSDDEIRKLLAGDMELNAQGLEHWLRHDAPGVRSPGA